MIKLDVNRVSNLIQEVADEHILPHFRNLKAGDVDYKIGDDPVTIADKEAEIALSTRLLGLLPGSNVVGEEAFYANRGISERFFGESPVWIIDPVDGTRNFVRGSPEFGVIVSLAERNQVIAGWIYDPTSKEVLTAEKGAGVWYENQRLNVLSPEKLENMHGFLGDRFFPFLEKSLDSMTIKPFFHPMKAGAHEYPRLLLNQPHFGKDERQAHFRASHSYTNPWDDAAGVLMHQEAGGYAAFWDGRPYSPSENGGLALAPDRDSWQALKAWCQSFCTLPD